MIRRLKHWLGIDQRRPADRWFSLDVGHLRWYVRWRPSVRRYLREVERRVNERDEVVIKEFRPMFRQLIITGSAEIWIGWKP